MGLDLVVENCTKPGHEAEWRRIVQQVFAGHELTDAEFDRFQEISVPAFQHAGAPCVGVDAVADEWIIKRRQAQTPEEVAETLEQYAGYYVLKLANCDGVPKYTHGGLYDGVDETSFRGSFLNSCGTAINRQLLLSAWEHKFPAEAAAYGRALLAAADAAETSPEQQQRNLMSRQGDLDLYELYPLPEQLDIVRAAGRWHVFWGERGHPIYAWF